MCNHHIAWVIIPLLEMDNEALFWIAGNSVIRWRFRDKNANMLIYSVNI